MTVSRDEIRTERLLLRSAREGDLEAMHAVLSDPVAMRFWSTCRIRRWSNAGLARSMIVPRRNSATTSCSSMTGD